MSCVHSDCDVCQSVRPRPLRCLNFLLLPSSMNSHINRGESTRYQQTGTLFLSSAGRPCEHRMPFAVAKIVEICNLFRSLLFNLHDLTCTA